MNRGLQEKMAIAGYTQTMKNLNRIYPVPEGLPAFKWETENESCKGDWRAIAEAMYNATTEQKGGE